MLGSVKVLVGKDDARDYRGARVKRTTVTAIECISGDGRYMNIWPAPTHRSNWTICPTPGWHYACSDSGYTDSQITMEWLQSIFNPQSRATADGKPRLEFCFANNIVSVVCPLKPPINSSHVILRSLLR